MLASPRGELTGRLYLARRAALERSALSRDDSTANAPLAVVADHVCRGGFTLPILPSEPITSSLRNNRHHIALFIGDDDVGHVMGDGAPFAELSGRLPEHFDPFEASQPRIGEVVDHPWREDILKSVQLPCVE